MFKKNSLNLYLLISEVFLYFDLFIKILFQIIFLENKIATYIKNDTRILKNVKYIVLKLN